MYRTSSIARTNELSPFHISSRSRRTAASTRSHCTYHQDIGDRHPLVISQAARPTLLHRRCRKSQVATTGPTGNPSCPRGDDRRADRRQGTQQRAIVLCMRTTASVLVIQRNPVSGAAVEEPEVSIDELMAMRAVACECYS